MSNESASRTISPNAAFFYIIPPGRYVKKTLKIALALCGISAGAYLAWLPWVPALKSGSPETFSYLELRRAQAEKKGRPFQPRVEWRRLDQISPKLVHAVVLAEDDVFYGHSGFDLDQIRVAVEMDLKKRKFAYGGSTLTQQVARTLYLSPSKNPFRKMKEALITVWMEAVLPKRRILELYLNCAEWGDGVFGAEAAARHYYGKSSSDLTAEESVALASILPSPRRWKPGADTPFMRRRRGDLMNRMRRDGYAPAETGGDGAGPAGGQDL